MGKIVEFNERCSSCKGTGLYQGLGERDGFAVVCYDCKGTGCFHYKHEYEDFVKRELKPGVLHVIEVNPGICVGRGLGEKPFIDFGGMPYEDWLKGKPFSQGMEMRRFTCPAWWYQAADYKKKPEWEECDCMGRPFSACSHFPNKDKCWERWDIEFGEIAKAMNSGKRLAFFVMETQMNGKGEYNALIAVEGEQGYHKTDWYWGKDFKVAQDIAAERNSRLGLSKKEAALIQCSTMRSVKMPEADDEVSRE